MTELVIREPSAHERECYAILIGLTEMRKQEILTEPLYWTYVDEILDEMLAGPEPGGQA